MREKLYKCLLDGGVSPYAGYKYPLPQNGEPGEWTPLIKHKIVECKVGYHLCRRQDVIYWLTNNLYEAEYRGKLYAFKDSVAARSVRLLRRVETWNKRAVYLYYADVVERVLHIFEREYPKDKRPREAIQACRDYANNLIDASKLKTAFNAAEAAAQEVAEAADQDYANNLIDRHSTALPAIWVAQAAWAATSVGHPPWAIASMDGYASWATVGCMARAAGVRATGARAIARIAALEAERKWHTDRLFEYIDGKIK